ncbi:acetyltransferase (GNAT) family protein [Hydrogenispora ethanolica]|uniref:Acetyltransferase (GNAT) family protein n=1 Tax=Hydrogenispora ethanolica TaxID=1082276 RepID=A0A4R1RUG0_HYDET|nr:GNAT family N-acetyltransferase [Hydrogenispora ethanolica]TCL70106.1 acetyltransferase (GNAT) family protein [Hydrogenispora ethanolica]
MAFTEITTLKVCDETTRSQALQVIEQVYLKEKQWIRLPENEIPHNIGESAQYSWFLALVNQKPAGVIRLVYDPSLEFPPELEVTLDAGVDLDRMARECRVADIGRFMIAPEFRKNIRVVLKLMRAAIQEVVERGYTHFLTDVFESDPNSPLHFHTKILGFERIGSHLRGELNCSSTRIILTLDILKAYQRLRERKDKIYLEVTEGIRELLDEKLAKRIAM